ncbi:hypothetical protein [Oceanobacillus oncorhynchi]|uniref:hypothetical protein n=1 Tax=Oceanobacillus oncorhynchi TaxID=545501 RepID=UPI0018692D6C|nr:hypothetical protein [Oceanobacillus oncorhynchi]
MPLVQQFAYICDFIGLRYKGDIIGEGVKPDDILKNEAAKKPINLEKNKKQKEEISNN